MLRGDPLRKKYQQLLYKHGMELENLFDETPRMETVEIEMKIRMILLDAIEHGLNEGYKQAYSERKRLSFTDEEQKIPISAAEKTRTSEQMFMEEFNKT